MSSRRRKPSQKQQAEHQFVTAAQFDQYHVLYNHKYQYVYFNATPPHLKVAYPNIADRFAWASDQVTMHMSWLYNARGTAYAVKAIADGGMMSSSPLHGPAPAEKAESVITSTLAYLDDPAFVKYAVVVEIADLAEACRVLGRLIGEEEPISYMRPYFNNSGIVVSRDQLYFYFQEPRQWKNDPLVLRAASIPVACELKNRWYPLNLHRLQAMFKALLGVGETSATMRFRDKRKGPARPLFLGTPGRHLTAVMPYSTTWKDDYGAANLNKAIERQQAGALAEIAEAAHAAHE